MDYEFSPDVLEEAFECIEDYSFGPVLESEVTARMMHEKSDKYTRRQYLDILKKAEKEGRFTSRIAKGGERAFKVVSKDERNSANS